jgi:DNA-binding response OmpR family regulator
MDKVADKIRVLLIEDEPDVLELYRLKLTIDDYDVVTAQSGQEGLDKANSEKPELIFLDIKMPGMDGFEVLKHLRANDATKDIPVVILSNFDEESMVEKGLALGANEYLIKSHFSPGSLSDKIQEFFHEGDSE